MGADAGPQLAKRHDVNAEAYEAYLRGRYFLNKRTREDIGKGIEYLRRATEVEPDYALAYAWLAVAYEMAYWFSAALPPGEVTAEEKKAATRALALDESLAEAHLAMAIVHLHALDLQGAAREQERAIAIRPGDADAHHAHAYCLAELGRADEAVAEIKLARDLDPLNVVMNVDVGEILLYAGRYDEAVKALKHAVEMDASRQNAHYDLALAYERKGMEREAVEEYLKNEALSGGAADVIASLKEAYAASGVKGFWRKKFEAAMEGSKSGYVAPIVMARLHARLGEKDRAFDWLEKAYAERSPSLADLKVDPVLEGLRSDPRYEDLAKRIGLE
jgi:tetratricopeptide (TPR) repeat protein